MGKLRRLRGSRPSPAMVVALVALFAALGGTATALRGKNSVRSDDIAPRAVKAPDIAPGAVDPFKPNLTKVSSAQGQVSTTSNTPVDLGGPTVTVKVPRGALAAVYAEADMLVSGGGADARAQVHLIELTEIPAAPVVLESGSAQVQTRRTAPGSGDQTGVVGASRAGWLVMQLSPGKHVFQLRYSREAGGNAVFANRKLWVSVIG
jgi:hypothetical protein